MIITFSHSELCSSDTIEQYYQQDKIAAVMDTAMQFMLQQHSTGIMFPYFEDLSPNKLFELDIYLTDINEGRQLNLTARNKDYATNILSYPSNISGLPNEVLDSMPNIILGELVICHPVIVKQADEQLKTVHHHLTHLLVHGLLHLLGFDHELNEASRIEMESFEVAILQKLGVANPYVMS